MFEQFRENIRLTGETFTAARHGFKSGIDTFDKAPRFKKAVWMSIIGAVVVSSITSEFSVPWYYQAILVLGIVVFPLCVWAGRTNHADI
jgi:hypothetical protein